MSGVPGQEDLDPRSRKLTIHFTRSAQIAALVALLIIIAFSGGLTVWILSYGQLFGLIFAAAGGLAACAIYVNNIAVHLWADDQWIGLASPWQHLRLRRDELESMRIVPSDPRTGLLCFFNRRDGSVAFSFPIRNWGRPQIEALARFASVPVVDETQPKRYVCPVCGYPGLNEPVRSGGIGSYEICPSCGFEFGRPDDSVERSYRAWREQWVRDGMPWWAERAGQQAPRDWDPKRQLEALGGGS